MGLLVAYARVDNRVENVNDPHQDHVDLAAKVPGEESGGHADGDLDIAAVALREAQEESGFKQLRLVSTELFDVDRHRIPARKNEPEHWHYDLRFMVEAHPDEPFVVSDESHDLAWIKIARMADANDEESMLRMARKTIAG